MPLIEVNGFRLHYIDRGLGEPVVFAHGFLFDGRQFEKQFLPLEQRGFRCISFDHRGQGQSDTPVGSYSIDQNAEDAARLIEALGLAPCHFVGLSMGGFVGMRLAARRPELIRTLTLVETSAEPEPPENAPKYRLLGKVMKYFGIRVIATRVMNILFGQKFMTDSSRAAEREKERQRLIKVNKKGALLTLEGVIGRQGVVDELARIRVPTLIIVGDQDVATKPVKAQRIHEGIAGSELVTIPGAGHSSPIEEPEAVNAALVPFLERHRGVAKQTA